MLLGHWVKLEWLELMEMRTRTTRIGFLEALAFPVDPVALAACHLADVKPLSVQLTVMNYAFPWKQLYLGVLMGSVSESHRPPHQNLAKWQIINCCSAAWLHS